MPDVFVSASLEIRAPRPQVAGIAGQASRAVEWLWAPAMVAEIAASRDLPDGTRQVVVADGNKLRDRVLEADDARVVIDSELRPRRAEVPTRHLVYELTLESGAGTTVAKLGIAMPDRESAPGVAEQRRWRRHGEQSLRRLAALATEA